MAAKPGSGKLEPIDNKYNLRHVETKDAKPCSVCWKLSTSVLITPYLTTFITTGNSPRKVITPLDLNFS
jgi:hypothetical protein